MRPRCQLPAATKTATPTIVAAVGTIRRHVDARSIGTSRFPPYTGATMKIVVIIALCAVVAALITAGVFLYRDRGRGNRVVIALAIRVGLSMALVAFLVFSYWMGWISPSGVR